MPELAEGTGLLYLKRALVGNAVYDGAAERNFVGIFQLIADGDAAGDGAYGDIEIFEAAVDVEVGGIAFHGGAEGHDNFVYGAALHAFHERVDMQVVGADAIHGRNDAAKHVIHAGILLGVFNGHYITHIFHHADEAVIAFGVGADAALFRIADVVAGAAILEFFAQADERIAEFAHRFGILPEQMQHIPEGCFAPHARQ